MEESVAHRRAVPPTQSGPARAETAFQARMLDGVSRTFALTIPQLPDDLHPVVANAYLLCRTVDTIEDEPNLSLEEKRDLSRRFVAVVEGGGDPQAFSEALAPLLSQSSLPAERELIRELGQVIRITRSFNDREQEAMARCVRIMAEGMVHFQEKGDLEGLEDMAEMDRYCYHVAGVVGEMLTELFCQYSDEIASRRTELTALAESFGQGLQMTNILKDVWDDRDRGFCWLPRTVFARHGFNLEEDLEPGRKQEAFARGLRELIAVAHGHLRDALRYVLLIPRKEVGIRKFCLWALGMAVLTLDKIHRNPDFTDGAQVKISRRAVKTTIGATRVAVRRDLLLKLLFRVASRRLPSPASGE